VIGIGRLGFWGRRRNVGLRGRSKALQRCARPHTIRAQLQPIAAASPTSLHGVIFMRCGCLFEVKEQGGGAATFARRL